MSRDRATLLDIVLAARDVVDFTAGVERGQFLRNRILQSAILHKLMVIGEAVKRLSNETRDRHPQIPWKDIAGLRDKLIHDYGQIDLGQVWDNIPSVIKHDRCAFNRHAALSPHKRRRAVALASGHYESIIMAAGITQARIPSLLKQLEPLIRENPGK